MYKRIRPRVNQSATTVVVRFDSIDTGPVRVGNSPDPERESWEMMILRNRSDDGDDDDALAF